MNFLTGEPASMPREAPVMPPPARGPGSGAMDRVMAVVCVLALLGFAWWSLAVPMLALPFHKPDASAQRSDAATAPSKTGDGTNTDTAAPLDLAAFRTPLWVAPPSPPQPVAAPARVPPDPPAPPLKWQLLAIINAATGAHAVPQAMLYDPDTDAVIELSTGQEHSGRVIEKIDNGRVMIREGKHSYTLSLEHPVSGGAK